MRMPKDIRLYLCPRTNHLQKRPGIFQTAILSSSWLMMDQDDCRLLAVFIQSFCEPLQLVLSEQAGGRKRFLQRIEDKPIDVLRAHQFCVASLEGFMRRLAVTEYIPKPLAIVVIAHAEPHRDLVLANCPQ